MTTERAKTDESVTSCNTSTTFNFTVGAIALAVAGVIGYLIYNSVAG